MRDLIDSVRMRLATAIAPKDGCEEIGDRWKRLDDQTGFKTGDRVLVMTEEYFSEYPMRVAEAEIGPTVEQPNGPEYYETIVGHGHWTMPLARRIRCFGWQGAIGWNASSGSTWPATPEGRSDLLRYLRGYVSHVQKIIIDLDKLA